MLEGRWCALLPAAPEDDFVHLDQAAKALGVSRRTVERMIERGQLQRDLRDNTPVAAVTKRSLVQVLEARRETNTTRQPRQATSAAPDLTTVLTAVERLTNVLDDQHRQLLAATEDRDQVAHERDDARLEAARLQGELEAHREYTDQVMAAVSQILDQEHTQLEQIAGATSGQARRGRRRLRGLLADAKVLVEGLRK
jgi:predicted transcriptional regulator